MHSLLFTLHLSFEIHSLYVNLHFFGFIKKIVFWCRVQTQTKRVPSDPAAAHHLDFRLQNLEKPMFSVGNFDLTL